MEERNEDNSWHVLYMEPWSIEELKLYFAKAKDTDSAVKQLMKKTVADKKTLDSLFDQFGGTLGIIFLYERRTHTLDMLVTRMVNKAATNYLALYKVLQNYDNLKHACLVAYMPKYITGQASMTEKNTKTY